MKAKRIIAAAAAVAVTVSLFAVTACNGGGGDGAQKLDTPQISLNESAGKVEWSPVGHATGYKVTVESGTSEEHSTENCYYPLATEPGTYTYTVVATSTDKKYSVSAPSAPVTYVVPEGDTSTPFAGKIYLVGDSTVCNYEKLDNAYLPRYGYGTQLFNYINCQPSQIVNLALSGKSSLSFLSESNYTTLKNSIAAGDYLIIGFGHNDEKDDDSSRYTTTKKDYEDETGNPPSFQNTLYKNYVKLAVDNGATPILCTPIVRYNASGSYTGTSVHVTDDGDYAQAIRTLGAATGTTVIDMTEITKALYLKDNTAARNFHFMTNYVGNWDDNTPDYSTIDTTHLNKFGAKAVAYELAQAIKASDCGLKANVITNSVAPTFETDFADARKEGYVNPVYSGFDPAANSGRKLCTLETATSSDWYKTVFGDLGGASKVGNFTVRYETEKFTVGNANKEGKIVDAGDGLAAAFTQISVDKNFTASAKFTITTLNAEADKQSSVGMMLRDDIYIDTHVKGIVSNFAAAGALHGLAALFHRESGTLENDAVSINLQVGVEYTVSIERQGQNIKTTFSDGTHDYEKNFQDFKMNIIDGANMYLCLYATRGVVAEFSQVQFEITGDAGNA